MAGEEEMVPPVTKVHNTAPDPAATAHRLPPAPMYTVPLWLMAGEDAPELSDKDVDHLMPTDVCGPV